MINLNRDTVFLDTFPFGKTQNIECRLGRKAYLLDVEKTMFPHSLLFTGN